MARAQRGRSVLHAAGDDLDHYSDGRPIATTLNVGAGARWVHTWHPDPDHPRNRPQDLGELITCNGTHRWVILTAPGILDAVSAFPGYESPSRAANCWARYWLPVPAGEIDGRRSLVPGILCAWRGGRRSTFPVNNTGLAGELGAAGAVAQARARHDPEGESAWESGGMRISADVFGSWPPHAG